MEITNGAHYSSNYARASASFLGTCAPMPQQPGRKKAYELITGIYDVIANEPEIIPLKIKEDVSFSPWEAQKGREKDVKLIRDSAKKIQKLMMEFYDLVQHSEVVNQGLRLPEEYKVGRQLSKLLTHLLSFEKDEATVLCMDHDCAEALKELVKISTDASKSHKEDVQEAYAFLLFSRCVFQPDDNWLAIAFDHLFHANGEIESLCSQLEQMGYERVVCNDGRKITLDYVKNYGKKDEPLKWSWAERNHAGIEMSFEDLRLEPAFLWIRMPQYNKVLSNITEFSDSTKKFLVEHTKTCDGCRYCVQTDKTGKRPLASYSIDNQKKCPRFPAFSMNWREVTKSLMKNIMNVLDELDQFMTCKV